MEQTEGEVSKCVGVGRSDLHRWERHAQQLSAHVMLPGEPPTLAVAVMCKSVKAIGGVQKLKVPAQAQQPPHPPQPLIFPLQVTIS